MLDETFLVMGDNMLSSSRLEMTKLWAMEKLLKEKGPFIIVDSTGEYSDIAKLVERKGGSV